MDVVYGIGGKKRAFGASMARVTPVGHGGAAIEPQSRHAGVPPWVSSETSVLTYIAPFSTTSM